MEYKKYTTFEPDYNNLVSAAKNISAKRLPLYEHIISEKVMEDILGRPFASLFNGDDKDVAEFFRNYCEFFRLMGYDTVSFECCIGPAMPGSGSLGGHKPGVIQSREDFEKYPWNEIPDTFFNMFGRYYRILRENMPQGMKAIGGPGNGVFELVQDVTNYMGLCYISADDPDLYRDMFFAVGDMMYKIWVRFIKEFGDIYCVNRFGDDLGFKSTTLISADDIRNLVIPQYRKIVGAIKTTGKPFLLHSCGCIFDVMDDIINEVGISAKHSNEDVIAPFPVWVERYGKKIGNFGGIDTDVLCQKKPEDIRRYILDLFDKLKSMGDCGGLAIGSGNSIPAYVPPEGYLAMVETVRDYRGEI
jgi:uroporphyrinogen decarboxylase